MWLCGLQGAIDSCCSYKLKEFENHSIPGGRKGWGHWVPRLQIAVFVRSQFLHRRVRYVTPCSLEVTRRFSGVYIYIWCRIIKLYSHTQLSTWKSTFQLVLYVTSTAEAGNGFVLNVCTAATLHGKRPRILTYLLTPWSRVLLEKLTRSAASQEIPRIFGTRRFLTVPTSARHPSLPWANSIQSPQPPSTSWRSILILPSHLRLGLKSSQNSDTKGRCGRSWRRKSVV